jgi:uncharacterized protein (TIGR00730 family)
MNICIFCSAAPVSDVYAEPARQLATLIAKRGDTLVWGGSDRGLMKVVAETAQAAGGRIVGITMEQLRPSILEGADEMIITKDLAERKQVMLARSDAIVTLVGGTGTLDEMTELFELKRHGLHHKPLIILNTAGFYDGLRTLWDHMADEGFLSRLPAPLYDMIQFADTPEAVMELLAEPAPRRPLVARQWAASPEAV